MLDNKWDFMVCIFEATEYLPVISDD
jgi:hypothetical protein